MLPDYPAVKAHLRGVLLRWCQAQIPQIAPLLGEIGRFHQHEGRSAQLVRSDESVDTMDYPATEVPLEISRDEMKRLDLDALFAKLRGLAENLAEAQERMMFTKVSEAVEATGNTISAEGRRARFRRGAAARA